MGSSSIPFEAVGSAEDGEEGADPRGHVTPEGHLVAVSIEGLVELFTRLEGAALCSDEVDRDGQDSMGVADGREEELDGAPDAQHGIGPGHQALRRHPLPLSSSTQ